MTVSLLSMLTNAASSSTTETTGLSAAAQKAIDAANAKRATATATATATTTAASTVTISDAAKAAAAAAADNAKDFTTLSREVRATLDTRQGTAKGGAGGTPDLSGLTGRALAAIALNTTGDFTHTEQSAAKSALRDQSRTSFTTTGASGYGMSSLATYSKHLVSQYDSMSTEERQARGWTDQTRASSSAFVDTASSSDATTSLIDMLGKT